MTDPALLVMSEILQHLLDRKGHGLVGVRLRQRSLDAKGGVPGQHTLNHESSQHGARFPSVAHDSTLRLDVRRLGLEHDPAEWGGGAVAGAGPDQHGPDLVDVPAPGRVPVAHGRTLDAAGGP